MLRSGSALVNGEGGALPELYARLQDWGVPELVCVATVVQARLKRAGRSRPERLRLQWHARPDRRPSSERVPEASDRLPCQRVPGDRACYAHPASAFPNRHTDAPALPRVQSARAGTSTRRRTG